MVIKCLVAYHKKAPIIINEVFTPIHVGKALSNENLGINITDNTGVNISIENNIYCEMTAVYWAWKNLKSDYIGLCHYRRFFFPQRHHSIYSLIKFVRYKLVSLFIDSININIYKNAIADQVSISDPIEVKMYCNIAANKINAILKDKKIDGIVTAPVLLKTSVEDFFISIGRSNIDRMKDLFKSDYPEYLCYMNKTLKGKKLYYANMFIFKQDLFNDYANYIFSFLEKYKNLMIDSNYCINFEEKCCSRLLGYISELLTDIYINKIIDTGKNIKESSILYYQE